MPGKTNVFELASVLSEAYGHLPLGKVNDHTAYVMHIKGAFDFHKHPKDELYLVLQGEMTLRFRSAPAVTLREGECLTVPAWVTHSSESAAGAQVLAVKPTDMFPRPQDTE